QNQITDDYYQTQYKILQSRGLARRTMDSLNLWTEPEFNAPVRQSSLSARSLLNTVVDLAAATMRLRKSAQAPAVPIPPAPGLPGVPGVPGVDDTATQSSGID